MKFLIFLLALNFSNADVVDKIMVIVNKSVVTQSDVEDLQKRLRTNGLVDETLLSLYDAKELQKNRQAALKYLVDTRIIDSEVEKQGLVAPIEQVESEIRKMARDRGVTRDQMVALLKRDGIKYSDYQNLIKTGLERQSLLQKEVTSKIKVSDDDINSYYIANHGKSQALIFEYTLAHIVLLKKNGGMDKALERAREVHARLNKGADFDTVAAQSSEDPEFSQGGLFGTFRVTDFNEEVRATISKLKEGDISQPVAMPDGAHVFKVIKRTLVPSPDLEKRRETIRRILTAENFRRYYDSWIQQMRRNAYIKYN